MKRGVWGIGGRGFLPGSVLLSMRGGFRHVIILVRFRLKLCHLIRWNRAYQQSWTSRLLRSHLLSLPGTPSKPAPIFTQYPLKAMSGRILLVCGCPCQTNPCLNHVRKSIEIQLKGVFKVDGMIKKTLHHITFALFPQKASWKNSFLRVFRALTNYLRGSVGILLDTIRGSPRFISTKHSTQQSKRYPSIQLRSIC